MQRAMSSSAVIATDSTLDDLRGQIRREPGTVYAILDACDEPRVPEKVQELGEQRAVSLYRGRAEEDYWAIAPHLAQIDEALLDWIVENLWDDPWGIFVVAQVEMSALRTHFRRFLMVEAPDGRKLYFRFYDPRMLPVFLRSCTPAEAKLFFGPIRRFCVKGEDGKLVRLDPADLPADARQKERGRLVGGASPAWPTSVTERSPFRVREGQMRAFSEELETRFVTRMVRHLRDDFPADLARQKLEVKDLEPLVRRGLAESRKYGVVNEGDVERYVECMVVLSPSFDVDPKFRWAKEILQREDLDGESKMDEIDEYRIFGLENPV